MHHRPLASIHVGQAVILAPLILWVSATKPAPEVHASIATHGQVHVVSYPLDFWSPARRDTPSFVELEAYNAMQQESYTKMRREPLPDLVKVLSDDGEWHGSGGGSDSIIELRHSKRKPSTDDSSDSGVDASSSNAQDNSQGSSDGGSGMGMGVIIGVLLVLGVIGGVCFFFRNTIQMYFGFAQMGSAAARGDAQGVVTAGGGVAKCAAKAVTSGVAFKVGHHVAKAGVNHAAQSVPPHLQQQYQAQAQAQLGSAQANAKAQMGNAQAHVSTAQAQIGTAQAQVGTAQAQIGTAQAQLGDAVKGSPQGMPAAPKMPSTPKMPAVPSGMPAVPAAAPVFKGPA